MKNYLSALSSLAFAMILGSCQTDSTATPTQTEEVKSEPAPAASAPIPQKNVATKISNTPLKIEKDRPDRLKVMQDSCGPHPYQVIDPPPAGSVAVGITQPLKSMKDRNPDPVQGYVYYQCRK